MNSRFTGTVCLTTSETVLIPAATSDPKDPINLPKWQKCLIIFNMSIFSAVSLSLISGLGGILNLYALRYRASGHDPSSLVSLMTFPVLTMGTGCLLGLPLSIGIGRRAVILGSSIISVFSIVLCATAKSYEWHLAARLILGLAAGQSEVLVPIIVQECFFLHQRSQSIIIQQAIQTLIATAFVLLASPIANALSPEAWYGIGGGFAAFQLLLTIFFHPETLYDRPIAAYAGLSNNIQRGQTTNHGNSSFQNERLSLQKPPINGAYNWSNRLQICRSPIRWLQTRLVLTNMFRVLRLPIILWAILTNGISLSAMIASATSYGTILLDEPYNWASSSISYANFGQVVVAVIAIPVFGYGSDSLIIRRARCNQGIHEPEVRLIPAALQVVVGVLGNALFAVGSADTVHYSWFLFVWCLAANNFCFVCVNIVSFAYILDSCAQTGDYMLTVICACRNFLSFGLIYGFANFMARNSYVEAFSTFAGLSFLSGILHVVLYTWGKKLRTSMSIYLAKIESNT